jgi:hypothetical protein
MSEEILKIIELIMTEYNDVVVTNKIAYSGKIFRLGNLKYPYLGKCKYSSSDNSQEINNSFTLVIDTENELSMILNGRKYDISKENMYQDLLYFFSVIENDIEKQIIGFANEYIEERRVADFQAKINAVLRIHDKRS